MKVFLSFLFLLCTALMPGPGPKKKYQSMGQEYDADVENYIARVVARGGTISLRDKDALNTAIVKLKDYGLYGTTNTEFWPFMGGTGPSVGVPFKGVAPNVVWNGTVTFGADGFQGDGSTGYGNSGITPATISPTGSDLHVSVYVLSNINTPSSSVSYCDVGAQQTTPSPVRVLYIDSRYFGNARYFHHDNTQTLSSVTNSQGMYEISRITSTQKVLYKNGVAISTANVNTTGSISAQLFWGANNAATAASFSPRKIGWGSMGPGHNATQAALYNQIIEEYMDARGIGVQP